MYDSNVLLNVFVTLSWKHEVLEQYRYQVTHNCNDKTDRDTCTCCWIRLITRTCPKSKIFTIGFTRKLQWIEWILCKWMTHFSGKRIKRNIYPKNLWKMHFARTPMASIYRNSGTLEKSVTFSDQEPKSLYNSFSPSSSLKPGSTNQSSSSSVYWQAQRTSANMSSTSTRFK